MDRKEMLKKAEERGYEVVMTTSDYKWYSLYNDRHMLNLQLWIDTGQFEINHAVKNSIVAITTNKCGSFMNDEHFKKIEKSIRKVVFDLL